MTADLGERPGISPEGGGTIGGMATRVSLNRRDNIARISFTDYDDADIAREYEVVEHDVRGDFSLLFDKRVWYSGSR